VSIRVVLADDQALVRTGFRLILAEADDIEVVGEASDGAEAIAATAATHPDVVLLTTFDIDEYVFAGLRAGASGFVLKDALAPDLLSAIRAVASGAAVVAPTITRRLIERFIGDAPADDRPDISVLDVLTAREREVLSLIARGLSNAEIAARLFLSEGTVKTHVGRVLAKLGLRDRIQAVILAYEVGLIRIGQGTA
jgi:DNA-binding NarL/FixJ family response regulator